MSVDMNDVGNFVLPFGKFKGKCLHEVDIKYLDWLLGNDRIWPETKDKILAYLKTCPEWVSMSTGV